MSIITVTEEDAGKRLDVFVHDNMPELSRSYIKRLCEDDKITVNHNVVKQKTKVKLDDSVDIKIDIGELMTIPDIDLPVIYEDDDCIVINKPAGILTHSKGAFNPEATVATFIAGKISGMTGDRAGIVHRLDRATSGVIICAKTPESLSWLQKQFSQRRVKKTYFALINGRISPEEAVINMPIERHPRTPKLFRTGQRGKPAETEYKVVEKSEDKELLRLRPKTGRTHQLRVHLKQIGFPIIGDSLYGGEIAKRMYLHAEELELTLPSRERRVFQAELPEDFHIKSN